MVSFLDHDSTSVQERARHIKTIIFDVDGVLTPGDITYDSEGREIKSFNVLDGHRIKVAQKMGLQVYLMTGRVSHVVKVRAAELGIDGLLQGVLKKGLFFKDFLGQNNFLPEEIAFLGDDLIDIPVLRKVGLAGAVKNCSADITRFCHLQTDRCGGEGAAAEFIEFILKSKGLWQEVLDYYEQDEPA
jgi:YrbI family 3-deoxy-D-manno-octulosonate 8-phosphate phosphatase